MDNSDSNIGKFEAGSYKVIYVYEINDGRHDGRLKVGDATYHTDKSIQEIIEESESQDPFRNVGFFYNTPEITAAARARIDQQTGTADIVYNLLWSALAVKPDLRATNTSENVSEDQASILISKPNSPVTHQQPVTYTSFRDYELHNVLLRSGIKKNFARKDKKTGEWFIATLDNVTDAFVALCQGKDSITANDEKVEITLRDEQKQAVKDTLKVFRKGSVENPKEFLWNAIMRFGKTLTSYALVKELDDVSKVLIMTHRPVVRSGWHEDFHKSFDSESGWKFGSKVLGESWDSLKDSENFFYFASMQDLRGSFINEDGLEVKDSEVEAIESLDPKAQSEKIFAKNAELFGTDFDLVIIDESHEGNSTELAQYVSDNLKTKYKLHLSGTPFNIIEDFENGNVYNWSYTQEQKTKAEWSARLEAWDKDPVKNPDDYPGEFNPYAKLPSIELRNMDVNKMIESNAGIDPQTTKFSFARFFEVDRKVAVKGSHYESYSPFKEPAAVTSLLNLISLSDEHGYIDKASGIVTKEHRNFPFSRDNSKKDFAHTFWVLPTVEAAVALHERLIAHPSFDGFKVVNATGDNDGGDALAAVKDAIKNNERTITLSVGKLTTGTTIPEWTAVFMLSNMKSPMLYMQTIFRVKSSGSLPDGRQKEVGYVFDFAPDRSLEMITESVAKVAASRPGFEDLSFFERQKIEEEEMDEMLKYLPVIVYDGVSFTEADTRAVMKSMERVYIYRAVDSGFSDPGLFKFDSHNLTIADMNFANSLTEIVGKSSMDSGIKRLEISKSLLSEADKKILKKPKPAKDAPEKEKDAWDEAADKLDGDRKNAKKMVQLLRGISARIPMLVFAADLHERVTLENFSQLVDDESWVEFMPKGFDKAAWIKLKEFFNKTVFEGACEEIQNRVKRMDDMPILERVAAVAHMFSSFARPDKETILTPWAVVNRQYADTLGGLRMVDNDGKWYTRPADYLEVTGEEIIGEILEASQSHTWTEIQDSGGQLVIAPKWTEVEEDLQNFWNSDYTTILDINSKTALYPLYSSISLWYRMREQFTKKFGKIDSTIEDDMWSEIVENQVFVNCRVPYSRKIAERVLTGYKKAKDSNGKPRKMRVNASVVDVMEVRTALKSAKLPKVNKDGSLAKAKRSLTDEEVSNVWKWIFNPDAMRGRNESEITVTETRAKRVVDLANKVDEAGFEKLLKEVAKSVVKDNELFSGIVSNPPYQMENDSNGSTSIYHHFMSVSQNISQKISMVYPLRWTNGGQGEGLIEFSKEETKSKKYLKYFATFNASDLFSSVEIKGGLNWFLWTKEDNKITKTIISGKYEERVSLSNGLDIVILSTLGSRLISEKIKTKRRFSEIIMPRYWYGTTLMNESSLMKIEDDDSEIRCFYAPKGSGAIKFKKIKGGEVRRELNDFKVFTLKTAPPIGWPQDESRRGRIFIGEPGDCVTASFLKVGNFKNYEDAKNCLLYMKTDTFVFLQTVVSVTHNAPRRNYDYIPLVDFTTGEILDKPGVFLDFSKSETLDDQLASIYNITNDERDLMIKDLKSWKDKTSVTADM